MVSVAVRIRSAQPSSLLDGADLEAVAKEVDDILSALRQQRPVEGSVEERQLLQQWVSFASGVSAVFLGSDGAMRETFRTLTAHELRNDLPLERRMAARSLERSLNVYRRLITLSAAGMSAKLAALSVEILNEAVANDAEPDQIWELLRWQLDFFAALECLEGAELEELKYWSDRAFEGSIRVEAWLDELLATSRQARSEAMQRARRAWVDWEDADIEKELGGWPATAS